MDRLALATVICEFAGIDHMLHLLMSVQGIVAFFRKIEFRYFLSSDFRSTNNYRKSSWARNNYRKFGWVMR